MVYDMANHFHLGERLSEPGLPRDIVLLLIIDQGRLHGMGSNVIIDLLRDGK